jgi:Uma2 family endonuclease
VTTLEARPRHKTLADLIEQIGSVPLNRIPAFPPPGTATEADVLASPDGEKHLYELVDGVLVEKPPGFFEAVIAARLIGHLGAYLDSNNLGVLTGANGPFRLAPGLVRMPDVSFIAWERFPGRKLPKEPIPDLAPDLAIEVLSVGNTAGEMRRKLRDYFDAGARLAWLIDPETQTARVYLSPVVFTEVASDDELDGGEVLPGFRVALAPLFANAADR